MKKLRLTRETLSHLNESERNAIHGAATLESNAEGFCVYTVIGRVCATGLDTMCDCLNLTMDWNGIKCGYEIALTNQASCECDTVIGCHV